MGQVIRINTREGGLPDALTEAGQSGLLSSGYLSEQPAVEAVEEGERMQFVLTNRKRGVTVERSDTTETVTPGSRYRTVAVVTDRRVVVLVGQSAGDKQTELSLADVTGVETTRGRRAGKLTLSLGELVCHIHTGTDGLDAVEQYLRDATEAWREVEAHLSQVEETLTAATDLLEDGEYDRALASVRSTRPELESARSAARQFNTDYPGSALHERLAAVSDSRRQTEASILVERARNAADTGDRLFEENNYEGAREAYERARDEYDAALDTAGSQLEAVERVRDERDRVDLLVTRLRESPLRKAIEADKAAVAADDSEVAADHWQTALDRYQTALQALEAGNRDPQVGDPERIRDRITAVAESLTASQRAIGNDAMRAGDWYANTGQYDAALEEFERATEAFGTALATAKAHYPEAVEHLQTERRALAQRIDRVEAKMNGDPIEDRIDTQDELPEEAAETLSAPETIGDPTDIEELVSFPSHSDELPEPTAKRLRQLDHGALTEVAANALDRTEMTVREAPSRSPFDLFARRNGDRLGIVVHTATDAVVSDEVVTHCAEVTGAAGTDGVVLVTTGHIPQPIEQLAEECDVRIFRTESLADIVDTEQVPMPASH